MRIFTLLAAILLIAAYSWRVSITGKDDDLPLTDWCPAPDTCIPAADIGRYGIPDYALSQSALPTEFAIRGLTVDGLTPEALGIAIYPEEGANLSSFELVETDAIPGFDQVRYAEKFGNQHTWRGMVGQRVREGEPFFAADNIKFFCVKAGRCIVLVHDGRFEAQFDIAEGEVPKLPRYRDRLIEVFHGWRAEP